MSLTTAEVRKLFDYANGHLYWKDSARDGWAGKRAGGINSRGYVTVRVNGKLHKAHRLIWLWHGNELIGEIDHINRLLDDNRIENLRICTRSQNSCNRSSHKKTKNVFWVERLKKFVVQININKVRKHIGCFEDFELAELVAIEARNKFHKEYACHV